MPENEAQTVKRIMPHDPVAERYTIGAMMMDRNAISECSAIITAEDFYNTQYGMVFQALCEIYNAGHEINLVVLAEQMRRDGAPSEIASQEFLNAILADMLTSQGAVEYARIIKDKAYLRKLIKETEQIQLDAYAGRQDVDTILQRSEESVFKLVQSRSGATDITEVKDVVLDVVGEIEAATQLRGKINGLRTGFTDLDLQLTGLHGGELILVAARPAMGKTAFVLNIAHHVATKENTPVLIFSLEMGKDQLVNRLIAVDSHVEAQKLKTGDLNDTDWDNIMESVDTLSSSKIFISDNSSVTIPELRSKARKLKATQGIGLIIIDYLQLMSPPGKVESRQQFISDVSRSLKNIARELDVPIIALSQLNRAVDSRPDHRPVLADLRESGAIEQDSDVVMFIYRDEYYNHDSELRGISEIIVAKQRNGSTGTVNLAWLGQYTKFANLLKKKDGPGGGDAGQNAS